MSALENHLHSISSTEFEPQGLAFFDLDRTLIAGFSILALALETARFGLKQGEFRQTTKVIKDTLKAHIDGSNNYDRLVRRLAKALTGVSEETLYMLGQKAYENTLAKSLYNEAITLIETHRRAGHKLILVSAASDYQVSHIASVLGFDDICCTHLEVQEGHFTGQVIAPLCYGKGKLMAARRIAKKYDTDLEQAWFYSDSKDDMPLLTQVGYPVATNPSEKLKVHARNKGWPILNFKSRGLPDLESLIRTVLTTEAIIATTAWGFISKRLGIEKDRRANDITRLAGDIGCSLAGMNLEVEGIEHLYQNRPAIFVFNHQSMLDTLVLAHLLRRDVVAYCKAEMSKVPVIGPLLRQTDTIFVDREGGDQREIFQRSLAVLKSGRSLVIAPEGTRSTLGDIQPFKQGAFLLAKKAGVPIVPIVLHNVKDAMPKGGLLIRPADIKVTVLPPVAPESLKNVRHTCADIERQYTEVLGHSKQACLPKGLNKVAAESSEGTQELDTPAVA
ncbi:MAG: HAD-IB family hydrolase [Candidatus Pelagadaptatus aseana]|uniref:HAD-IB family hydrolase n=1 Tax=Candidatus Pelagadaptatus aseana TaxID=3120508 RepID=UPI0039B2CB7C